MAIANSQISRQYFYSPCMNLYHIEWDDVCGPMILAQVSNFTISENVDIALQLFNIFLSVFGGFQPKNVNRPCQHAFFPIANIEKTAHVFFDFRYDPKVRGQKSAYLAAAVGDFDYDDYEIVEEYMFEAMGVLKHQKECDLLQYHAEIMQKLLLKLENCSYIN